MHACRTFLTISLLSLSILGCATSSSKEKTSLQSAKAPAWSVRTSQDEMIVAVSPVRQSVQLLGASAAILGAGVDAMVDAKYRDMVREALGDYKPGKVFEERLAKRLAETAPATLKQTPPLQSTAGFQTTKEAEKARMGGMAKAGHDMLMDLKMTYGVFGYEGMLATRLDGTLVNLPTGKRLWKKTLVVTTEPLLASDKLADPTSRMGSTAPRFSVDENAVSRWTQNGGQILRTNFESAVDAVVSALLCDLGLAKEAVGEYYLGKLAMNHKQFEEAETHFAAALALDPASRDALNGRSVNLGHNHQFDDAIKVAIALTESAPDYGPAWYNLSWWYAIEKKDPAKAAPCYEKAIALGMPKESRIEKALSKNK